MKILQVVPGIAPSFGGPGTALTDMTRALCDKGIDAMLVTTNSDPTGRLQVPLDRITTSRGAPVRYYRLWPRSRWGFSVELAWALWSTAGQFDVIHIYWMYNFSSLAAAASARRAGVPYLIQPNGSLDPTLMKRNRWMKNLYNSVFGRFIIQGAAALIFASQGERGLAEWTGRRPAEYIVPVGLDWKEYRNLPERGGLRRKFPELDGKRIILFLSRLTYQKGLDILIPAFRIVAEQHADAHLLLAGPDGEGYAASVRTWIAEAGLTARVTFAGRIPDDEKLSAYVDSDVFVLPSRAENFGAVVTEAMACRLPVVISDKVNISREVGEGGGGIVVPLDVVAVAGGIDRVLRDPAMAAQMGRIAREMVRTRFTWDAAFETLIPLYGELAARRSD